MSAVLKSEIDFFEISFDNEDIAKGFRFVDSISPSEISGTAVHAQKFEYGVEKGELYKKEIIIGDSGSEALWTKNYVNFLGKQYKTAYPDSSTITLYFDELGHEVKRVGQTGITFLTAYDSLGRVSARVHAFGTMRNRKGLFRQRLG